MKYLQQNICYPRQIYHCWLRNEGVLKPFHYNNYFPYTYIAVTFWWCFSPLLISIMYPFHVTLWLWNWILISIPSSMFHVSKFNEIFFIYLLFSLNFNTFYSVLKLKKYYVLVFVTMRMDVLFRPNKYICVIFWW